MFHDMIASFIDSARRRDDLFTTHGEYLEPSIWQDASLPRPPFSLRLRLTAANLLIAAGLWLRSGAGWR